MSPKNPLDTFRISGTSIMDAVFSSKLYRRPQWATTTHEAVSTLWRIEKNGTLVECAKIVWWEAGNKRNVPCIIRDGQVIPASEFLVKSKGLFTSGSRTFLVGGSLCKWKLVEMQMVEAIGSAYLKTEWQCTAPPIDNSSSPTILASFTSPKPGFDRSEFTIYAATQLFNPSNNPDETYTLLFLSAILTSSHKDDWRTAQSLLSPSTLEAKLSANASGTLPPYIPSLANSDRLVRPVNRPSLQYRSSLQVATLTERSQPLSRRARSLMATPRSAPPPYSLSEPPAQRRSKSESGGQPSRELDGYHAPRPTS